MIDEHTPIETFTTADYPPEVAWQAMTFMRCRWTSMFEAGGLRTARRPYEPDVRPTYLVRRHAGVVLAHAAVIRLTVEHDGQRLDVAGLGCVFTMPPYRGAGHARDVVEAAGAFIDASDADVAGLFCEPHLPPFYERFGWTACPGGSTDGDGAAVEDLRMMRFLSPAGHGLRESLVTTPLRVPWPW